MKRMRMMLRRWKMSKVYALRWWLAGVAVFHLLPMAVGLVLLYLLTR